MCCGRCPSRRQRLGESRHRTAWGESPRGGRGMVWHLLCGSLWGENLPGRTSGPKCGSWPKARPAVLKARDPHPLVSGQGAAREGSLGWTGAGRKRGAVPGLSGGGRHAAPSILCSVSACAPWRRADPHVPARRACRCVVMLGRPGGLEDTCAGSVPTPVGRVDGVSRTLAHPQAPFWTRRRPRLPLWT